MNMPIPDYQSIMLPLLKLVDDGKEHSLRATADVLAEKFKLSPEEKIKLYSLTQTNLLT